MTNRLYYGDNLGILREHIADESVDLVYLDPPFNSNATYNVLFKSPEGKESPAPTPSVSARPSVRINLRTKASSTFDGPLRHFVTPPP